MDLATFARAIETRNENQVRAVLAPMVWAVHEKYGHNVDHFVRGVHDVADVTVTDPRRITGLKFALFCCIDRVGVPEIAACREGDLKKLRVWQKRLNDIFKGVGTTFGVKECVHEVEVAWQTT